MLGRAAVAMWWEVAPEIAVLANELSEAAFAAHGATARVEGFYHPAHSLTLKELR